MANVKPDDVHVDPNIQVNHDTVRRTASKWGAAHAGLSSDGKTIVYTEGGGPNARICGTEKLRPPDKQT